VQSQSGIYSSSVCLNAPGEAHEEAKSTRSSVREPGVEIAYGWSCDEAPKALKQMVASGDAFVVGEDVLEHLMFVFIDMQYRNWLPARSSRLGTHAVLTGAAPG